LFAELSRCRLVEIKSLLLESRSLDRDGPIHGHGVALIRPTALSDGIKKRSRTILATNEKIAPLFGAPVPGILIPDDDILIHEIVAYRGIVAAVGEAQAFLGEGRFATH